MDDQDFDLTAALSMEGRIRTPGEILATGAAWVTESELDRLVTENARLKEAQSTLLPIDVWQARAQVAEAENVGYRAENERLREALERMRDASPQSYDWYQSIASSALKGETDG